MTHRGDSDWHGWSLQAIVEPLAQKRYEALREHWPSEIRAKTPETLVELGRRDTDGNALMRQVMSLTTALVVEVLDVVNGMDHPLVSDLERILSVGEIEEQSPERIVSNISAVVADYRENIKEV